MQEKIQLLRKALMDYLVCISAQDFSILVCIIIVLRRLCFVPKICIWLLIFIMCKSNDVSSVSITVVGDSC